MPAVSIQQYKNELKKKSWARNQNQINERLGFN